MRFSSRRIVFLCLIALTSTTFSFVLEGHIKLTGYNFAYLASFCGNASGPVVHYNFSYPQAYCSYQLFSYFQDQWWKIWPRPELDCHEKARVLKHDENQVLNLGTNSSRAGCRVVVSESGSNILCQGSQIYQVQTNDILTKKCWFLAVSNCNSTGSSTLQGIQMDYSLNITGASPNMAPKHHHRNLLGMALTFIVINFGLSLL